MTATTEAQPCIRCDDFSIIMDLLASMCIQSLIGVIYQCMPLYAIYGDSFERTKLFQGSRGFTRPRLPTHRFVDSCSNSWIHAPTHRTWTRGSSRIMRTHRCQRCLNVALCCLNVACILLSNRSVLFSKCSIFSSKFSLDSVTVCTIFFVPLVRRFEAGATAASSQPIAALAADCA